MEWIPRPADNKDTGCSWFELLIDFEVVTKATVRNSELLQRDDAALLRRESSIGEAIKLFQAETLKQVQCRFTADVSHMFAPCKGRARLSCLGIKTCTPCFQAWPNWDSARHIEVIAIVLAQRGADLARARAGLTD